MSEKFKWGLGWVVRDVVTGYSGRIVGRAQWLTGCHSYLVVPQIDKSTDPFPDGRWFDQDRLIIVDPRSPISTPEPAGPSAG